MAQKARSFYRRDGKLHGKEKGEWVRYFISNEKLSYSKAVKKVDQLIEDKKLKPYILTAE